MKVPPFLKMECPACGRVTMMPADECTLSVRAGRLVLLFPCPWLGEVAEWLADHPARLPVLLANPVRRDPLAVAYLARKKAPR